MRLILLAAVLATAVGCGDGGNAKPANPVPKMDLDAAAQKKAGDFAPGP
jgi:hypothetical protein